MSVAARACSGAIFALDEKRTGQDLEQRRSTFEPFQGRNAGQPRGDMHFPLAAQIFAPGGASFSKLREVEIGCGVQRGPCGTSTDAEPITTAHPQGCESARRTAARIEAGTSPPGSCLHSDTVRFNASHAALHFAHRSR